MAGKRGISYGTDLKRTDHPRPRKEKAKKHQGPEAGSRKACRRYRRRDERGFIVPGSAGRWQAAHPSGSVVSQEIQKKKGWGTVPALHIESVLPSLSFGT